MMKYNCEDILALMDEYLDGETEPLISAAIEDHLAGCESCLHELEERADMRRIIAGAAPTPPEGLHDEIMMKVHAETLRKRRMKLARNLSAVAAVFVLAVGIAAAWMSGAADKASTDEFMKPSDMGNAGNTAPGNDAPSYSDKEQLEFAGGANNSDGCNENDMSDPGNANAPEASDTAIYELRFSEYGKGYSGGLAVYAEDADETLMKKLALALGADFDGTAFVTPDRDASRDTIVRFLPGFDNYPSARVGDGSSDSAQCIIIFIK